MAEPPPVRCTRRIRATLVLLAAIGGVATLACSEGGTGAAGSAGAGTTSTAGLVGLQRADPIAVGQLSLPDARTGEPFLPVPPAGELHLIYFGYTSCPDVCPTSFSDLRRALRELGERASRVTVTFISVDPARDTAEILDGYLGSFLDETHTPYHLVRLQDPEALRAAQAPFGVRSSLGPKAADGSYEVTHTAAMYVVDASGSVVVEWPFGTPSTAMAGDLRLLLARGAASASGTAPATSLQP